MFEDLFATWQAYRDAQGGANQEAAFDAFMVLEDHLEALANAGNLDAAATAALKVMDIEDAGDFYADLISFASQCELEATANGEPASVSVRAFGIPAMGEHGEMGRLHHNAALVRSVRGSGLAGKDDIVELLGAVPMDEAARMSPQAMWNLVNASAHVLSQVHSAGFDASEAYNLRRLAPVLPDEQGHDEIAVVGCAMLLGLRVHIALPEEMAADELEADPIDEPPPEIIAQWEDQSAAAMQDSPLCVVMLPMPWREGVVQAMCTAAESQILREGQDRVPLIDKMSIGPTNDGVVLTGYAEDGGRLGQYHIPSDVSFWALTDVVGQLQGQGMDVELLPSTHVDLAAMPSPGKMLN